jgi:hypothetical protein
MPRLEGYRFGHLVVNGEKQTRDVTVLPERVVTNWRPADGHRLVLHDSKMSARASRSTWSSVLALAGGCNPIRQHRRLRRRRSTWGGNRSGSHLNTPWGEHC